MISDKWVLVLFSFLLSLFKTRDQSWTSRNLAVSFCSCPFAFILILATQNEDQLHQIIKRLGFARPRVLLLLVLSLCFHFWSELKHHTVDSARKKGSISHGCDGIKMVGFEFENDGRSNFDCFSWYSFNGCPS